MTNHQRPFLLAVFTIAIAAAAVAADFGAHVGYYDNDAKKAYIGVDAALPIGPVAIMPNIDYWRQSGFGYWIGNADLDLKYTPTGGPSFWFGAGPTYGRITGSGSGGGSGYAMQPAPFDYTPPSPTPSPSPSPGNPQNPPNSGNLTTGGPFGNGRNNAWGWDVNGGVSFGKFGGNFQPYITARYNKIKDYTAGGVAIGLRFGH